MKSVFTNHRHKPTEEELKSALGDTFDIWEELVKFTEKQNLHATEEWKFAGEKYGWSFRISDKKRVLIYLLPRDKFFKAAFVFGQKATDAIMEGNISENIKVELKSAKKYAEGRGIRIEVKDRTYLDDLKELIAIKISR